jgi:hypothetical protein
MIRAKQHLARWTGIRCVAIAFFGVIACSPFCTAGSDFQLAWTTTLHTNSDSKVALAPPLAIIRDRHLLFYGTEGGLLAFDISDRSSAVWLSEIVTEGWVRSIALKNGVAHLIDTREGLITVDISDPNELRRLDALYVGDGEYGGPRAVALLNNRAYVAVDNEGLAIVDITNPAHLGLVGHADLGGRVSDVVISEGQGLAILGAAPDTVLRLDFAAPDVPRKLEELQLAGLRGERGEIPASWILYDGETICGNQHPSAQGVKTHDMWSLADFHIPSYVGRFRSHNPLISDRDGMAYSFTLAWGDEHISEVQLAAYHLSRSGNPQRLGRLSGSGQAVVLLDDHAYMTETWYEDLNDGQPARPRSRFEVIDISEPADSQRVGRLADVAGQMAISGDHVLVAAGDSGLQSIDVSDPLYPKRSGGRETGGFASDVAVSGNYAYLADGSAGLQIFDISDPTNPKWAGGHDLINGAFEIVVSDQFAFVLDGRGSLRVIDVGAPTDPREVGAYGIDGYAHGLAVSGHHAYLVGQDLRLQVVDASDPGNLRLVGHCAISGIGEGISVSGDHAYVAAWYTGLYVIDISDPTNPMWVGHHGGDAYYWSPRVAVQDDNVYVTHEDGLSIFGLFRPLVLSAMPVTTAGQPFRLKISGPPGSSLRLQRSANLLDWEDWVTLTLGDDPVEIGDPEAGFTPHRFYRATE